MIIFTLHHNWKETQNFKPYGKSETFKTTIKFDFFSTLDSYLGIDVYLAFQSTHESYTALYSIAPMVGRLKWFLKCSKYQDLINLQGLITQHCVEKLAR